jgi:hypothetical protein
MQVKVLVYEYYNKKETPITITANGKFNIEFLECDQERNKVQAGNP